MCSQYDYSKEVEVENKKQSDAQVKLRNQIEILNDTITKLENINSDTLSNCQALNSENVALKKVLILQYISLKCFKKLIICVVIHVKNSLGYRRT